VTPSNRIAAPNAVISTRSQVLLASLLAAERQADKYHAGQRVALSDFGRRHFGRIIMFNGRSAAIPKCRHFLPRRVVI
jgi:hypothetical protein